MTAPIGSGRRSRRAWRVAALAALSLVGGCSWWGTVAGAVGGVVGGVVGGAPDAAAEAPEAGVEAEAADWFCDDGQTSGGWSCVEDRGVAGDAAGAAEASGTPEAAADDGRSPAADPARQPERQPHRDLAYRPDRPTPLTEVPADYYVVQLVALTSKEALEEYAKRKELRGMSAARVERGGALYYVLLLGVYPDRRRADLAAADLPEAFAEFAPWVRRVGSLQEAIRRADALAGTSEI